MTALSNALVGKVTSKDVHTNSMLVLPAGTVLKFSDLLMLNTMRVEEVEIDTHLSGIVEGWSKKFNPAQVDIALITGLSKYKQASIISAIIDNIWKEEIKGPLGKYLNSIGDTMHCKNVAFLAYFVGSAMGLNARKIKQLVYGGLYHDIGKSQLNPDILYSHSRLSQEEKEHIRMHPKLGYDILKSAGVDATICDIALHHHESYNGSGYPHNLKFFKTDMLTQIIHLCDVYDAMCAKRSYKDAKSRVGVRAYIERFEGTMFHPRVVECFLRIIPIILPGERIVINGIPMILVSYTSSELVFRNVSMRGTVTFTTKEFIEQVSIANNFTIWR